MKVAILGSRSSVVYFLSLGLTVVFVNDSETCKNELHTLLKNGFRLIYITDNFSECISVIVDKLQTKYSATITFIPSAGNTADLGLNMLKTYAERATGGTTCLN